MLSRRKMFNWLSAIAGGSVGTWFGVVVDQTAQAGHPPPFPRTCDSPPLPSGDFIKWQKWFRDHPHLLWANEPRNKLEIARIHAVKAAEIWQEWHPKYEYSAWVENVTDNLLLRIYTRDREGPDRTEYALCMAVTRRGLELEEAADTDKMAALFHDCWAELTQTLKRCQADPEMYAKIYGGRTAPSAWASEVMGMAEAKATGGAGWQA